MSSDASCPSELTLKTIGVKLPEVLLASPITALTLTSEAEHVLMMEH